MGVYKYDATNDVLVPIAGTSAQGIEDKVSTYTADSSYWDTAPSDSSTKPLTSGAIYTALSGKAPTSHASTETTYGVASDVDYGHVKTGVGITNSSGTISVSYGSAAGTACEGNDSRLSDVRVPSSHASSDVNTYGGGNASNYGHVKLTDSYNTSSSVAAVNSVGASGKAVYDSYMLKANQAIIATRQANSTASKTYNVGDQFILNNVLKRAKATIQSGTEITTGNSENAPDITTQIGNLANPISKSMTGGYTFTINVVKNLGKLQVVSGGVSCPAGGTSAGNYLHIANVPDAPANNIVLPASIIYSTYTYPTKIKISTNKKVEVFVSNKMQDDIGQNTAEVVFSGSYIIA